MCPGLPLGNTSLFVSVFTPALDRSRINFYTLQCSAIPGTSARPSTSCLPTRLQSVRYTLVHLLRSIYQYTLVHFPTFHTLTDPSSPQDAR